MVLTEARLYATHVAMAIGDKANTKETNEFGPFAGTAACLVMQTIVVSLALQKFPPGSPEGEAFLRELYDNAWKDAQERWHKSDLKERRASGHI